MWFFVFAWQILCCAMIPRVWSMTRQQLQHYFPSFSTKSEGRQQYVVKNVAKSLILCFLTPPSIWIINRIIFYGTWDQALIQSMGALYSANDIVALFTMWNKIPTTTKIHHLCVLVFSFLNVLYIDYTDSAQIWRHTAILAALSTPTYSVNTYLGIRCLEGISDKEKRRFADFALSKYGFCISLSFVYQITTLCLHQVWSWDLPLYLVALFSIYYDDFHLSTYLWDHSNCKKNK